MPLNILYAGHSHHLAHYLEDLHVEGMKLDSVGTLSDALERLRVARPDLLIVDAGLRGNALELLWRARQARPVPRTMLLVDGSYREWAEKNLGGEVDFVASLDDECKEARAFVEGLAHRNINQGA